MQLIIYQRFIIRMNIRGKVRRCLQLVRHEKKKLEEPFWWVGWMLCILIIFCIFFKRSFSANFFHHHKNFGICTIARRTSRWRKKFFFTLSRFFSPLSHFTVGIKKKENSKAFNRWTSDESGATFFSFFFEWIFFL